MITKKEYDALKTKATKKLTDKEKRDMALYKDYTKTLAKVIAHKTALAKLTDCRANDYKENCTKPYTNKADKTALARKDGYTVMAKGKKIASGNHYSNMTKRATAEKGTLIYKIK